MRRVHNYVVQWVVSAGRLDGLPAVPLPCRSAAGSSGPAATSTPAKPGRSV